MTPAERPAPRDPFRWLLRAEWTKFRTVRGWLAGLAVAAVAIVLIGTVTANGNPACGGTAADCTPPKGPGGEPVSDFFSFTHRTLPGDGTLTVHLAALTGRYQQPPPPSRPNARPTTRSGLEGWAKAGIMVKDGTRPGSSYAALLVTGGHGIRLQSDFTHDRAAADSATTGRAAWLRLVRRGAVLTGATSADGVHWRPAGTMTLGRRLADRPLLAGVFAASPGHSDLSRRLFGTDESGGPSLATAVFDHLALTPAGSPTPAGAAAGDTSAAWRDTVVGADPSRAGLNGFDRRAGTLTVRGSGDIAPAVGGVGQGVSATAAQALIGTFAGLIAVIVVAVLFVTSEYRRGLILLTLAASPRRGRVLAAKALVVGGAVGAAGAAAAAVALPLVSGMLRGNGFTLYPVGWVTELRVVLGTGALLGVAAVLAMALGAVLRRGAGAVVCGIAVIVLPYMLAVASALPPGAADWVLRVTPAAAFAVQQTIPRFTQVTGSYLPSDGYYPLPPWAGLGVLCGYAAAALALAAVLLRRRDA